MFRKSDNITVRLNWTTSIDYGLKLKINEIDHEESSRLTDIFEREIIDKLSERDTSR